MRDRQQKKAQSKINHAVRNLNKNLKNDNLWRGRFFVRQTAHNWERFEDGSGGELRVWLEIRDLKTGNFYGFSVDNYGTEWKVWEVANMFITEMSGVWKDINEVKNDKTNWSKVKWVPKHEFYR